MLQAAVNYGQYAYAGYMPNYPVSARKTLPEEGTPEYEQLRLNPDAFILEGLPTQTETIEVGIVIAVLAADC